MGKIYRVVLSNTVAAQPHSCDGCIFNSINHEFGADDNCTEPDELDCAMRGIWELEEIK